jgi:hypothetical protein
VNLVAQAPPTLYSYARVGNGSRRSARKPWRIVNNLTQKTSFHIGVPQKLGPSFFVFVACDLPGRISPLQKLQRRLHLSVGSPPHGDHEGKEQDPDEEPQKPPIQMHSTKVVHNRISFLSSNRGACCLVADEHPALKLTAEPT